MSLSKQRTFNDFTCIRLRTEGNFYTALIDSGSNCNIITESQINALELHDKVTWTPAPVIAFDNKVTKFKGKVKIKFHIADNTFEEVFYVLDHLSTGTGALLGTGFLKKTCAHVRYYQNGSKLSLNQGEFEVAVIESMKQNVTKGRYAGHVFKT